MLTFLLKKISTEKRGFHQTKFYNIRGMKALKQNRLNRMGALRMIFILITAGFSFVAHGAPAGPVTSPGKNNSSLKAPFPTGQAARRSEGEPRASSLLGRKNNIPFARSLPEDISNENFPDIIESFDYPNAPLMDLIQAIGKLTGMNFIIDPGVASKKITIMAPSKITVAEAYKAFLSALSANGYTIVKSGAFWKIRETKTALKDNTEIYSGGYFPNTDQLITRIIRLKHINATEFAKSIKPLASAGQQVSSHDSSNTIIISDYGSVIERIMKLVRVMDVPGSEETVQIIPVIHASAGNMAEILSELLGTGKRSSTFRASSRRSSPKRISSVSLTNQKSGNIKVSHIIPDERTNSLIISANKNGMKRVKGLIKKLDTYVDGGVYVYNVLYGTAEQVYNTLMGISPSKMTSGPRTYTTGRRYGASSRSGARSKSRPLTSSTSPLFQNVTIMADTNTNSLIISARNRHDLKRVKTVLKKIDVPKDQVFVQAVIVEMFVGRGDAWETNIAGKLMDGISKKITEKVGLKGEVPIIGGYLNRGLSPDESMIKKLSFGPGFVLGFPFAKLLGLTGVGGEGRPQSEEDIYNEVSGRMFDGADFESISTDTEKRRLVLNEVNRIRNSGTNRVLNQALHSALFPLLQILKEVGDVNVLSTPQLTAMDNVKATIEVGENAPVGLTSTSSGGLNVNNSVERADVVLKLELTPRINPDSGIIQMDIMQKFDDFSSKQSTASELKSRAVHITKRSIETKLILHDGETAVLGGLMTDKEVRNENKVPLLGDIPVFGWLFKGSTVTKQKRNLIVFLTPTIIRGKDQKNQTRRLLGKKLDERIDFIKKNMRGTDPHGDFLKKLTEGKAISPSAEAERFEEPAPPEYKGSPDLLEIEEIEEPEEPPAPSLNLREETAPPEEPPSPVTPINESPAFQDIPEKTRTKEEAPLPPEPLEESLETEEIEEPEEAPELPVKSDEKESSAETKTEEPFIPFKIRNTPEKPERWEKENLPPDPELLEESPEMEEIEEEAKEEAPLETPATTTEKDSSDEEESSAPKKTITPNGENGEDSATEKKEPVLIEHIDLFPE